MAPSEAIDQGRCHLTLSMHEGMALAVFAVGILSSVSGIGMILSREYQQAMKGISAQANSLHAKALQEVGVVPVLDASARLVKAVNDLVRTAMGVGAFLCLVGIAFCALGLWMISV